MQLAVLLLSAVVQPSRPLDPGELAVLCKALKATATPPSSEYGEFTCEFTEPTAEDPENRKPKTFGYRHAIDGEREFWFLDRLDGNQVVQSWLFCRNDRLDFKLVRHAGGWAFDAFGAKGGGLSRHMSWFGELVNKTYAIQDVNAAELLANPSFRVSGVRQGSQNYVLSGTRIEQAGDGILQFRCTIRVSTGRSYAYIVSAGSTSTSQGGDRRDMVESVNTVREDADRPRLQTSATVRVTTMEGKVYRNEHRVTYKTQSPTVEEHRAKFELAYYGLREPVIPASPAVGGQPSETDTEVNQPRKLTMLWLGVALVAGLVVFLIGRRLVHFKSGTAETGISPQA